MDGHPSQNGQICREILDLAHDLPVRLIDSYDRRHLPMKVTVAAGNHVVQRVIDVDLDFDRDLETRTIMVVIESMVVRLQSRTLIPSHAWTWRAEVASPDEVEGGCRTR